MVNGGATILCFNNGASSCCQFLEWFGCSSAIVLTGTCRTSSSYLSKWMTAQIITALCALLQAEKERLKSEKEAEIQRQKEQKDLEKLREQQQKEAEKQR